MYIHIYVLPLLYWASWAIKVGLQHGHISNELAPQSLRVCCHQYSWGWTDPRGMEIAADIKTKSITRPVRGWAWLKPSSRGAGCLWRARGAFEGWHGEAWSPAGPGDPPGQQPSRLVGQGEPEAGCSTGAGMEVGTASEGAVI